MTLEWYKCEVTCEIMYTSKCATCTTGVKMSQNMGTSTVFHIFEYSKRQHLLWVWENVHIQ